MNAFANRAMNQYKQVGTRAKADVADPHQLIVMLFDGALERIAIAKGAVARKNGAERGQKISSTIAIIDGLIASLDKDNGGEVADNLEALYYYMQRRLLVANVENSLDPLDEVASLLKDVRSAWINIPMEQRVAANG